MSAFVNPSAAPAPSPEGTAPRPVEVPPQHGSRKVWLLVAGVLAAGALSAWLLRSRPQQKVATTTVIRTAKVTRGPFEVTLRAAGTTTARNFANITAPMMRGREASSALVLMYLAKSGGLVKKNDIIAQIDAQAMKDHVDDINALVVQADADIRKRQAEQAIEMENLQQSLRVARSTLAKAKLDYSAQEIRTPIDQEQLKLSVEEADASYNEQVKDIKTKEASFAAELRILELTRDRHARHRDRHKIDVERFTIRAPIPGLVVMQSIWRQGDMGQVQVGDQIYPGQPFMKIVDTSNMLLEATVNQVESEGVRIGQRAKIDFDAFPDLHMTGKVHAVGALAISSGRVNYYIRCVPVRMQIEGSDSRLIPDLSASGDIVVDRKEDVLSVPQEAVHVENGKSVVYVKTGDQFRRQEIQVGEDNATYVIVTGGLQAGEEVALQKPGKV